MVRRRHLLNMPRASRGLLRSDLWLPQMLSLSSIALLFLFPIPPQPPVPYRGLDLLFPTTLPPIIVRLNKLRVGAAARLEPLCLSPLRKPTTTSRSGWHPSFLARQAVPCHPRPSRSSNSFASAQPPQLRSAAGRVRPSTNLPKCRCDLVSTTKFIDLVARSPSTYMTQNHYCYCGAKKAPRRHQRREIYWRCITAI